MRRTCTEPDCDRPAFGRGLCSAHYQRARYHGQLPDEPAPRPCAHCGEPFTSRKWNADYCSNRCNDAARHQRKREAKGRRADSCEQCGSSLSDKRPHARFCSPKCSNDFNNAKQYAATRAAKLANRPPCKGCGGPIPPARTGHALYCSRECKIRSHRHQTYGLTKQELDLLLAQHEHCAICRTDDWGKKGPQVDHCHDTGRVRGILCGNCNQGLGRFRDDPKRLRAASRYLEAHL